MTKKERIAYKIDSEGLPIWLDEFFTPEDIKEPDLRQVCIEARDVLEKLDELLDKYGYIL